MCGKIEIFAQKSATPNGNAPWDRGSGLRHADYRERRMGAR